jgi:hypothetical protein
MDEATREYSQEASPSMAGAPIVDVGGRKAILNDRTAILWTSSSR